ncbi:uncharacterized protein LOC115239785 [Formica exsecta]|uniref:uncharacterized protein LOC115239785 n=1 Tax=Formica exsecta TaxID=72781 RepID=UPI001141FFC6|nr:uncharacterized protein LOC115239785 [Formica exsecta]
MRLDPFGLTGPPTSKKRRREKKREEKKEQQQLWSSSSSSSASLVECVRFVRAASTRSFSGSIRDRVEARHHDGPDDNEEAGTATAFRVPRDSASRGVVRARTRDCHEDHEDENDYDGDADVGVVFAGAPPARTRILCVDRPSPQRRAPRFARRARGRARRRRERGPIPEERPDVAASVVSFVDVLAYTAYSDDRDDDDDDDGDDEGRTRYKRKRIHGGPEEDHDKHTENGNDDDNDARVSVPGNEQERRDAKENAPREDYIRAEVDTINRGVPKDDHQWASPSSLLDGREDRRCECIDNYDCEHPTVDEEFDGQGRRKGEGWRRSDNTAWFQKPITRRRGGGTGEKPRTRRSYYRLLLFMLYLLAWPLLCSTSPSGHFTSTFTQNPTLAHIKNPAQRGNASPPDVSYLSSTVIMQHQHQQPQQYVQGSDYNTDNERHRHHQQQQQEQQQERKEKRENSGREKELQSRFPDRTIYNWDVNQLNPWLSACDLAGPAPADLQGSCGPPEVPKSCPMPCENENEMIGGRAGINSARTTTTRTGVEDRYGEEKKKEEGVRTAREQCLLYLEESHKGKICRDDSGRSTPNFSLRKDRYRFVSRLRLRHCCEQAVVNALAPGKDGPLEDVLNGGQKCADTLDKLLIIDALAARLHCEFEEVLARYDCAQPYSVIHNCTHCKEAYRKWVCSSLVPYFAHGGPMDAETPGGSRTGTRLRPCRSFCQSVEQRCPYLLPGDRAPAYPTQYAGEPTFLCGDPNIPETGEQAARALHNSNDNECCFHVCAEDAPISGICANCEEPWKNGRYDPSTAPQCDTAAPQSGPTDQQYPGSQAGQPEAVTDREPADDGQETSTASSSSSTPASSSTTTTDKQGTLFCGSGRIGSIPSASSPGRSSPSIVLQLFWLCSVLISLPANALQYNLASSWSPFGFFRLIGSGLPGAFVLRRTFNDLRASAFDPRSAGIYRHAVVRCLLFILWMPRRAVTKCRRRGWWWWRSWRRSSSRHFRWKLPRRASGVASWRSILRDASTSSILVLFLKFAEKCRCRDWWWLWRRWRKCGSTDGQDAGLVRRKRSTTVHGTRRRGHRRGRGLSGIFETDVASLAKATSRKDPP